MQKLLRNLKMQYKKLLNITILLLLIFIIGCSQAKEKPIEKSEEEVVDTGILAVESKPSAAQVYVDNRFKGETPFTLYNIPAGQHKVVIRKDGYLDYEKMVTVQVGRTESVDISLNSAKPVEEQKSVEEVQEKPEGMPVKTLNKINYSSFAMYYDFENQLFTDIRTEKSDVFSRKYDNYINFAPMSGARINGINKALRDVDKEDCIFPDAAIVLLYSDQTLCINTVEGNVVVLGWKESPNELEWKLFG